MFEAHVLHLLRKYLGEYVHGLSAEALRISVWKGDVVLKDLKLKAEALNSLKLPVTVKAGFVGTITLKVPWKSLGKEPVIVLIDRVFVLANPAPDGKTFKDEDKESLYEAKRLQIEEAESATLEAKSRSKTGNPQSGTSWLGSLIATIIGNLKISITNVHIRYEDSLSNPGCPFSLGVTLAKLAAVTMDELGNETFDTSGALDKLRKSLQLERLAFYHDSNSAPWSIEKRWEDLTPTEWVEIFEDGISEDIACHSASRIWSVNRKYVVSPINGALKYHRLGKQERNDPEVPCEKASLVLTDVSVTVSEFQYHDWIKLYECFSRYKIYVEISHLRPKVEVSQGPHLWWRYAAQATVERKKICYRFSWDQIKHMCQLRRHYIQLYANSLQQGPIDNSSELKEIEQDLDSKVILLWRLLAHAKMETVKLKEEAEQRRNRKKSWFPFRRYNPEDDVPVEDASGSLSLNQGGFTKEEWHAINNFLSFQPDEDLILHSGKDVQNVIQYLVGISIEQAAARIISNSETEIVCGRFEQLHISTKFRKRSTDCDLSLRFYGLSSPEGSLAESVSSKQKENALAASFVYSPVGENVDWKLSATISPCHVTLWMESYDRFMEFVKRSNAISPAVAMETATALQMKFEKVTRRAQEQFQMVLEEQSRFALDIDLDAPKVRIPVRMSASSKCDSHFLLDFGHFTLVTKECHSSDPGHDLYSRFYISGRDIAALFADCDSDYQNCNFVLPMYSAHSGISPLQSPDDSFPLIDRCGVAVIVDQIKVPHPSYPSTRVSIQVPNLGIHFSPARYSRLMELMNILYGTVENAQTTVDAFDSEMAPWHPADLSASARILVWKGIGNSLATWQPCYLVLSGMYLYVLESEKSLNYQRWSSMAGRQIHEVPPSSVGNSTLCIAVSFRGMDIQKALESSSTWVIEFRDADEKATWMKGLIQATYKASVPAFVDLLEGSGQNVQNFIGQAASIKKIADLVVNGALVETQLFLYGKTGDINNDCPDKHKETLILEVLAGGGKVHVTCLDGDLTIKTKLHSLKIIDELQGRSSDHPHYLAYSVLKSEYSKESPHTHEPRERHVALSHADEDETFTDALPDFTCSLDQLVSSPHMNDQFSSRTEYDNAFSLLEAAEALIYENESGKGSSGDIFYEAQGNDNNFDFVAFSFSTRSSSSLDYDGIDTQMSIRMSKLEFFCNRPTLVALISFGLDLSSIIDGLSNMEVKVADDVSVLNEVNREDSGHAYIKGLLGYGKRRVVFNLYMDVDSVSMFLNKEDGTQLAMLVQESFLLDLKVYPSSLSIEGTLGNFKLRDLSSETDHCWSWLCDIRNPGSDSLIKFTFNSYSAEDDDYEGFDYSLHGHLSAVRIVFLYRFVQEITVYFMELATPHTEEAIKLVDKVGGLEWLIQKSEMEGSSAVKLDLYLDTPIIIVPRDSISKNFIQLDLGQLRITNNISWHGNHREDPSAVHVDVLHAEILGINMTVGDGIFLGKPMIREGNGLDVFVRRSLRDVFKKVPTFSLDVKVGQLHAVMSDKEYHIIVDCSSTNLCEVPNLPPSFRGSSSNSMDTMKLLADKVNLNSQIVLSRNVTIVGVEVKYALLELCNGIDEESPLAHISMEGLWVTYRMTSLSETDLYVTIPKFSIMDVRPDTKPEMRLMLGSATDAFKQVISGSFPPAVHKGAIMRTTSEVSTAVDTPVSTMFLMDYRWRVSSQSFVIRIQQPRVLVVPDFLLAVGEFFVPALGSITGREETADPTKDPISKHNCTILCEPIYHQTEDIIYFSPFKQLVVDTAEIDEYTYDGCGKTICLSMGTDSKGNDSVALQPIVIIGRGKRVRFINVKIENGSLLRKCTYLSNDSSYSVSPEDGVDIVLLDSSSTNAKINIDYMDESSEVSTISLDPPSKIQSFTFEAQIVSPEFTFYDGTKSSLDNFMVGEKLLRAKMDMSFMYASKENDTWIRALLKDLTIESGSGLIVLDPLDLSGGYTSVKDKTSISLTSTDIYINLSLSVISLILNLQNQAAIALQFGNASSLALCTNFEQIWVSPKETGPHNNITFWRPKAPSNYVILGDCVTSRPIPPSQAVVAVRNMYGRVRKPLGFTLVGCFSDIQLMEGDDNHMNNDYECCIWLPTPPPGYVSLGCVVQTGRHPPPNHIVYCLRADLVASTNYLECMLNLNSNSKLPSGFGIWRCDNVAGSFHAHTSAEYPVKSLCCDLSYMLLWYSSMQKKAAPDATTNKDSSKQETDQHSSSSGWDILRSKSKASECYMSTPNFERIWWDRGSELRRPVSIWRPIARAGYATLGDCITEGIEPPALGVIFKANSLEISAKPVQFTKVARIAGKGLDEIFFWYPIAPPGYASLGCVVTKTDAAPPPELFCCPRLELVKPATILEIPISKSANLKSSHCWSIWKVENQACTFLARPDFRKPSNRLAYTIGDSIKPKARENVTADMKLKCFSLSIVDSLCGMMTPVVNTTITNIKVATHGRMEAMNAVLVSSIAASTFNTQLEAWEPLIEPFDGIFKFETYDTGGNPLPGTGKRIRVAATSILNLNISAAILDTFAETVVSWRRQVELEERAVKLNEEVGSHDRHGDDSTLAALDEDDFQTVIIENMLGCEIYLKKIGQCTDTVEKLHHDTCSSIWISPPRFSDRVNYVDQSKEARHYVAIQIIEAKGLPIVDDGNSHNFFCALRLVVDNHTTDQQKLFPQSARTKCVKPLTRKAIDVDGGSAKWNELFIFEIPRKGTAKLEVEVTNLAAKAGKGEVVGASSFSIGYGVSALKKVASARMLYQASDMHNVVSYPLRRKGQPTSDDKLLDHASLSICTNYFEKKLSGNCQRETKTESVVENEVGFWMGLSAEGPWESFDTLFPLSVIPKTVDSDFVAMEVVMKNGKKHAVFRGLATFVNDSDVKLEILVCSVSAVQSQENVSKINNSNIVDEEVFENQRCQPISGLGSGQSSFRNIDPGRWSNRDYSFSSMDFFEPPLPTGWQWVSTWAVDKSSSVDRDGWAYGQEFQNLKWPVNSQKSSTKSAVDVVRRRRWIRKRQCSVEEGRSCSDGFFAVVNPGSSCVLPWRSLLRGTEQCLQVRPFADLQPPWPWGHTVAMGSSDAFGKDQFVMESPLSKQNTIKQGNKFPNYLFKLDQLEKKDMLVCSISKSENEQFWLSVGADASVLHTELNEPVYDWNISVNSPLRLENRLPCPAEFTIWEKAKDRGVIQRQHGIIPSRKSVHVYSADVQKSLHLTLLVHGGWVLEKDPVLVLDLMSSDHVSSFWMVHQQTKRRLRVSIERDMGANGAAPKTIRFFVPYWIVNDSSLLLAYKLVEIESLDNVDIDSIFLSRTKSAKISNPEKRHLGARKNIQVLEVIEDTSPMPSMLSPRDYASRSGVMLFPSRSDAYLSARVGISVAVRHSENFSPGISLLELENKERVDVKAFRSDGSYYKLSALLNMTSDRTKVIYFQPHTLFINRTGVAICLRQCDSSYLEWIQPSDPPKTIAWASSGKAELLKLRVDGYSWSSPFSVSSEGLMGIYLEKDSGCERLNLRVEVRSGTKGSRYEVVLRPNSFSSPYRIENRSVFLPLRYRQVDGTSESWRSLLPNTAAGFSWEDLGRQKLLEILADGAPPSKSSTYNVDEVCDHQPIHIEGGPARALRVTIGKEDKINVIKISDWLPENEPAADMVRSLSLLSPYYQNDVLHQQSQSMSNAEFHFTVEVTELGVSIIDHTPEEILYLSIQNLLVSHSSGMGSGITRYKLRMRGIQVDNQLPLSPMPVLFRPHRVGDEDADTIFKFSMTMQSNGSLDLCVYPYIFLHGPENSAFCINIHEPIIWRLHEMIQQVNLSRMYDTQKTVVSVDPVIQIGVLNISEIRLKVSMAMSPTQRPRGVLGFWSSLMTALGNTENMQVKINQRFHEKVCMRQSAMITNAISNVQKDLLSQPLQLLSGVDILGNASSALGHMSKGVAALSMDKKFIQSRQRQESKGVEDFADVIREGGGAFAKGLFRGVTGILTKPLEGAKSSGVEGFVQGVGKGIIGAAAQPVSGVLDLLSKTTEGANAMRMKIAAAITSEEQLLRIRFPRVIGGDNLLRPYDEYKAQGQVILQLAESGSFLGQVDLFKVRGKFALSDAYEDHFLLRKGKILIITHRRLILLQQPSNIIQRKFSAARDPCSILWDVMWDSLATMELSHGKKDRPKSPHSRLILYLQTKSTDVKDIIRIIKCVRETSQALEVYAAIEHAMNTYGPNKSKGMLKRKVTKPYSPTDEPSAAEGSSKDPVCAWSPQQSPLAVPLLSTFGSSSGAS